MLNFFGGFAPESQFKYTSTFYFELNNIQFRFILDQANNRPVTLN